MGTKQWLDEADQLAEESKRKGDFNVGAVLVICKEGRKKPLARGRNTRVEDGYAFNSHAEMKAMLEGTKTLKATRLRDSILYTSLEPCPMCYAAATLIELKGIVFRTPDKKGGVFSTGLMDSFTDSKTWVLPEKKQGLDEHTSQVFHAMVRKIISTFGAILSGGAARPELLKVTGDLDFHIPKPFDRDLAESIGLQFIGSVQHDEYSTITRCTFDGLAVDFVYENNKEERESIFKNMVIKEIEEISIPTISYSDSERTQGYKQKRMFGGHDVPTSH